MSYPPRQSGVRAGRPVTHLSVDVECPYCGAATRWDFNPLELESAVGWSVRREPQQTVAVAVGTCGACEREIEVDVLAIHKEGGR